MRTSLTVVDAATGARVDVVAELEPDDTLAALETALAAVLPAAGAGLWLGAEPLDPATPVRASAVRSGSLLALGGPGGPPAESARAELHVVSGPDAGTVLPLPDGDGVVGRDQLPGAGVSRRALGLHVGTAGVVAADLGGEPSVRLAGEVLDGPRAVGPTDLLELGADLVRVVATQREQAAVAQGDEGEVLVTRPPRLRPGATVRAVELPSPPTPTEPRRLAVLPLLLPVLLGVVLAVLSSPLFLLFTLLSPLLALSTWWTDRRTAARTSARDQATYDTASVAAQEEVSRLVAQETAARRDACPDPPTVLGAATGPGTRLWERRRFDDDSLLLRLGTGCGAATSVRLAAASSTSPPGPPLLRDVPVTVPWREVGVIGVAGPSSTARSLARWLVAQTVVLHSPRDLSTWLLVDPAAPDPEPDWHWWRWLPHAAGPEGTLLVGTDADGLTARVGELVALVSARVAAAADVRGQLDARRLPDVLVVLDGGRALRALPGMARVLRDGPAVGVHALCLDTEDRLLPEECQAVVLCDGGGALLTVRRAGTDALTGVRGDQVSAAWAEAVARGLAPLRDATPEDGHSQLPSTARLLDVLGMPEPTASSILQRWGRTSSAVVGVGAEGAFALDLLRDGPHALIAGTTGAGKSELLQTLVASLAVVNSPDALTFVLVDYKGGAAFKDCARLPHTVGMVTDLDGHLVERALASLTAELKARELLLGRAGAKDLEDYWAGSPSTPLPRLVLVIDEFASLVEELPDFVRGLVGIAQRGRSLGVHLVLATQRPSGVVSPEIRANTNLRVALRVTDAGESVDVLDAPDAASIARSTPGRAWVRTGHASLAAFQTARVGGRAPGLATGQRPAVSVLLRPWALLGAALPPPRALDSEPEQDATDLHALVEAIREAAALRALPPARSPWLPPLPEVVTLDVVRRTRDADDPARDPVRREPDAVRPATGRRAPLAPVAYGLEDLPGEQAQRAAVLDLEHGGHLLVAGAARTGRSTLLRTLACSLATTVSPSDAHLYVLDCGNGALLGLAELQHCGAVVTRTQTERADRLLSRLAAEVTRRQELLADRGFADVAEQRASSADPLPYLVLLVDRWEGFTAAFEEVDAGRLTETLLRLLREGPGAGLRVVVTGDRTALLGKLASLIEDTLVLRLADRSDYALAGLSPRLVPEQLGPGRALRTASGTEVQIALLTSDTSGAAEAEAVTALAAAQTGRVGRRPFRVDVLPTRVTWAEARQLGAAPAGAPLGVGGDELTLHAVDLAAHGPGFTIAGPARSGRSTALLALAGSLLETGMSLCLLTPRSSPLRELASTAGVLHLDTSADPDPEGLLAVLQAATGPLAVMVDDAELLATSAIGDLLQQVLREGRDRGHHVVVAGTTDDLAATFRGFTVDVRKSRSGLLLSPESPLHGELLGVRLPRSASFSGPAGRGLLVRNGQVQLVQVPVPG